jgi:hypothetical protein
MRPPAERRPTAPLVRRVERRVVYAECRSCHEPVTGRLELGGLPTRCAHCGRGLKWLGPPPATLHDAGKSS